MKIPHGIHTGASVFSALCIIGSVLAVVPEMAKGSHYHRQDRVAPLIPTGEEVRLHSTKDGSKWAVVKIWGYKYSPLTKEFDVAVLQDTLKMSEISYIVIESDDKPKGIWCWFFFRNAVGGWEKVIVSPELARKYPEIFTGLIRGN